MDVFLSWSGGRSKAAAQALQEWLPLVINAVDPWISAEMDKGSRWDDEISTRLEKTKVGIICLTLENLEEKWIHFEAGALSKTKDAYVWTLLIDIKTPSEVEFPLAKFQHTKAEKDDVYRLVKTINKAVEKSEEKSLQEGHLRRAFEKYWPDLEKQLKAAVELSVTATKIERKPNDMLQEILQLVRGQDRRLSQLEHGRLSQLERDAMVTGYYKAITAGEKMDEERRRRIVEQLATKATSATLQEFLSELAELQSRGILKPSSRGHVTQDPMDVGTDNNLESPDGKD